MFKQRLHEHTRTVHNADTDKNETEDHNWKNDYIIDQNNKNVNVYIIIILW